MFKRILLAVAFVAALGFGGLGMSQSAEAGHCYRSYPRAYHSYHGSSFGPRFHYYRHSPWYGHHYGRHGRHSGFHFSIGF